MAEIPLEHITVQNLDIAHAVCGDGEKQVLLLHGWGAHSGLIWPLAERLAHMGYHCYVPDLPGFGQSQEPPQPWTVYDYAAFVLNYMDAQRLKRVYLFGHSFGGRLSLILGAEHRERIIKMALADSAGIRPSTPLWPRIRLNTYKLMRNGLYRIGAHALADNLRNWYGKRYGSADYQAVSGVMRQTFIQVVNEDLQAFAARVHIPTLLFWGDKDEDTPLWQGKKLEEIMPDAGLIVHEGAGHYSYLERLQETARIMDYFFKQEA